MRPKAARNVVFQVRLKRPVRDHTAFGLSVNVAIESAGEEYGDATARIAKIGLKDDPSIVKIYAVRPAGHHAPHVQGDTARFEYSFQIRYQLVLVTRVASFDLDFCRPFLPDLSKLIKEVTKSPIFPIISKHIRVFDSKEREELSPTK